MTFATQFQPFKMPKTSIEFNIPSIKPFKPQNNQQFPITESHKPNDSLLRFLVLETFKTQPCGIKVQHNHKQCQFYHYPKDHKRIGDFYSSELCEYIENSQICPKTDQCKKSHSCVEQLYRQDKYKTKFCSQYPYNTDNCEYGDFCSFAHHEEEILIELLHRLDKNEDFFMFKFKTVMCPFSSLPHDKAQCVYSHNWQDFRRKPNLFPYSPVACPHWKFTNYIVNYADGCPLSGNCDKCHGWKELDYHPLVYKTKLCSNGQNCHRTFECPFYHSEEEKRVIDAQIKNNIFRYAPKNRMAALKKKSEPIISKSNNPNFQNKLRKLEKNAENYINGSPKISSTIKPFSNSSLLTWELDKKLSLLKLDSFSSPTTTSQPTKKTNDFLLGDVSFNLFYPEIVKDSKILDLKDSPKYDSKEKIRSCGNDNITLFENNFSTKSQSSNEPSLEFLNF